MPNKCRCPKCGWVYNVPDDIIGKSTRCQKCRETLLVRAIGGKTALVLAGVSGSAPTQSIAMPAPIAAKPVPPVRRSRTPYILAGAGCLVLFALFGIAGGGIALWMSRAPGNSPTRTGSDTMSQSGRIPTPPTSEESPKSGTNPTLPADSRQTQASARGEDAAIHCRRIVEGMVFLPS